MSDSVYIAGVFEHPVREAPDKSTMQLHAEVARGALQDGGIEKDAVDAYFTAGVPEDGSALTPLIMADYLGLELSYGDTTDYGGSTHITHVGHAVSAIRDGRANVALLTLAGRPRSRDRSTGSELPAVVSMQDSFENIFGVTTLTKYATAAQRHMHEFGTTSEQLAEIRVAASHHAQYNDHAMYREPVTVEEVIDSPVVADPLHLLDCCVISDGGGALIVVSEEVQEGLTRECVEILGYGEAAKHHDAGRVDLTYTGAQTSGQRAYGNAGLGPDDVDYVSIYDSFTITVLETIEDLGFCEKGEGGEFVSGGTLKAPHGELPFNTDGGGLCSNHPANRGGITKVIEAVRQIRGEVPNEVQVNPDVALAHGTGGDIAMRHGSATLILGGDS